MTRKRERDEKRREERERENGKLALLLRLQPVHHHPLLLYYFTHLLPTVKPVLLYSFYYLLRSFSTQALLPKPYTLNFQQLLFSWIEFPHCFLARGHTQTTHFVKRKRNHGHRRRVREQQVRRRRAGTLYFFLTHNTQTNVSEEFLSIEFSLRPRLLQLSLASPV